MKKHRVFVGIPVPDSVMQPWHRAMTQLKVSPLLKQPHITLAFIGDMTGEQIQQLDQRLSEISLKRFCVNLQASGYFKVKAKHILWAGVESEPSLLLLQRQVAERVAAVIPIQTESSFVPHVSLVRHKSFTQAQLTDIQQHLSEYQAELDIEQFSLYRSELTSKGAKYQLLHSYNLF